MESIDSPEHFAVDFARALVAREYERASRMTATPSDGGNSPKALQRSFERIVPMNFGPVDPIEVGGVMDEWPDKGSDDVLWVYVHLGGRTYAEAITVVVSRKPEGLKIKVIEWGRP